MMPVHPSPSPDVISTTSCNLLKMDEVSENLSKMDEVSEGGGVIGRW